MLMKSHCRVMGISDGVADASFVAKLFDSNSFYVIFCYISGLCCFLPLFLGIESNLEDRPVRESICSSLEFSYSCIASIALVIPLLIDILFDIRNSFDQSPTAVKKRLKSRSSGSERFYFLNISERILILLGVAILPTLVFVPKSTSNLALIYVCCCKCQQNWVGGTVAISLRRYDKEYFSNSFAFFSLANFGFGLITSAFVDNIYTIKPVPQSIYLLDMIAYVSCLLPCLLFICNSFRWILLVHCGASKWDNVLFFYTKFRPTRNPDESSAPDHTFFPMVYTFCGTVVILLLVVLVSISPRIEDYTKSNLLLNNIPFLVFVLLVSILSMRMVKFEVVQGLYALIESKKSYVRYISHELRTPLNSAFLGLKLLTDDLSCSNNPKDMDRNEILADVNVACRTAVDILNDLLCLDKMESGVMEVHKHEVPVVSFILDCVGMFSAQAREGCVAMSVVTTTDKITQSADSNERTKQSGDSIDRITQSSDFQSHLSLLDSDIVSIDRFKMDQVVRNLISNALKFTPKGGSVVVTASFVPNHTVDPVSIGGTCPSSRSNTIMTRLIDSTKSVPVPKTKRFAKRFSKIHVGPDYLEGDADSSKDIEVPTTIAGKLVIVVKDTGVGMLEKNYCRLFKEIVQFNPEVLQAGGGSGLGLWITKGIVDLHGGSVRAHSEGLGQGSSFVVELLMERKVRNSSRLVNPLVSAAKDAPLSYFDCHVKDDIGEGSQKAVVLHLLVVDDSPLNRKMLLRTLRAVGHICEEAEDGLEAIVRVKARMASTAKSYSAILIDFVMPNMDGPTATKEIRAMGYTAPIFGVTGNILDTDILYFMGCGADRVLAKPLNMNLFNSCIGELTPCYSV